MFLLRAVVYFWDILFFFFYEGRLPKAIGLRTFSVEYVAAAFYRMNLALVYVLRTNFEDFFSLFLSLYLSLFLSFFLSLPISPYLPLSFSFSLILPILSLSLSFSLSLSLSHTQIQQVASASHTPFSNFAALYQSLVPHSLTLSHTHSPPSSHSRWVHHFLELTLASFG